MLKACNVDNQADTISFGTHDPTIKGLCKCPSEFKGNVVKVFNILGCYKCRIFDANVLLWFYNRDNRCHQNENDRTKTGSQ